MRPPKNQALFVEHRGYRLRRLRDAALLLPVLGAILFALPLVDLSGAETPTTRSAGLYFFVAWLLLVVLAAYLSRRLVRDAGAND